tara:strand:- start:3159 stop:3371 length:213 start_codon:yes stop_codon:yes gene_type:complete
MTPRRYRTFERNAVLYRSIPVVHFSQPQDRSHKRISMWRDFDHFYVHLFADTGLTKEVVRKLNKKLGIQI